MKTSRSFLDSGLMGIALMFVGSGLGAAPLTWFPGPPLDSPLSGAATTLFAGGANLLIGGDSSYVLQSYPQSLAATNIYWTYLTPMYGVRIAPGAVANGGIIIVYGGSDGTSSMSSVIGYSPSGDSTLTLASISVARSDLAACRT
jgi:hypothetical protein